MHFLPKLKLPRKILSLILIKYICFCDKPIPTKNEEKKPGQTKAERCRKIYLFFVTNQSRKMQQHASSRSELCCSAAAAAAANEASQKKPGLLVERIPAAS
jgi:hypothetical protein